MSKVTVPVLAGLMSLARVATSEMLSPTIAVVVALVFSSGVAFSTSVFSPVARQTPSTALLLASPEKWAIQWYSPAPVAAVLKLAEV